MQNSIQSCELGLLYVNQTILLGLTEGAARLAQAGAKLTGAGAAAPHPRLSQALVRGDRIELPIPTRHRLHSFDQRQYIRLSVWFPLFAHLDKRFDHSYSNVPSVQMVV